MERKKGNELYDVEPNMFRVVKGIGYNKEAKEEGFDRIAYLFDAVGKIEKEHEERYLKLLENVESGKVFDCGEVKVWKCRNCGHIHVGEKAPEVCPVCSHPKAYFEIKAENY